MGSEDLVVQTRKIVLIDEEKCDGCGLCVPACEEGAIQIIDGKACLVSDVYCDGLGACLGHCPRGAISIIEREAKAFDESAVAQRVRTPHNPNPATARLSLPVAGRNGGCPGTMAKQLRPSLDPPRLNHGRQSHTDSESADASERQASQLGNWPVQLHLVPPQASYLHRADLLLVADCVPFAFADFHRRFLDGRPVLIGCPKLDDAQRYVHKLTEIIRSADIRSITVVHMEVPCCSGLMQIAKAAIQAVETNIPLQDVTISIRGEELTPAHAT